MEYKRQLYIYEPSYDDIAMERRGVSTTFCKASANQKVVAGQEQSRSTFLPLNAVAVYMKA